MAIRLHTFRRVNVSPDRFAIFRRHERTTMSKVSTHELDLQIQLSLVAKIREAARRYKAEPLEPGSAALLAYVAALESLANHIEGRCRNSQLSRANELRSERLRKPPLPETAKARGDHRVIPFPVAGATPTSAA